MRDRVWQYYREFRDHQRRVQSDGGGMLTVFVSGRTELSYASAPYGEHALSAFLMAKRHAAFLGRMKEYAR